MRKGSSGKGPLDPAEVGGIERSALRALDAHDPRAALKILMDGFGPKIYGYCLKMVREPQDAQDMLTITFTHAFHSLETFERRSSLRTWLFGIAYHRCLDFLRARKTEADHFEPILKDFPSKGESPDDVAIRKLREQQLTRCLQELTPRVRSTVALRFNYGFTYPEMSELTGERAPTLQARVARALKVLRECLVSHGVTP